MTFDQYTTANPCDDCPAPCCQAQIHTYRAPATFKDLDMARYRLLFPQTELVACPAGDWYVLHWKTCSLFEPETHSCSAQDTASKPRVCAFFNQYECWFKQNFVLDTDTPPLRLNHARFERWLEAVSLDDRGGVLSMPTIEASCEIVQDLPISPVFRRLGAGTKTILRKVLQREG